jgi:hypothetical protein
MYGATCLGVAGGPAVAALLLLALAEQAGTDHFELLAELVTRDGWRTDSMGLGTISYWPGIRVTGVVAEDVDEWAEPVADGRADGPPASRRSPSPPSSSSRPRFTEASSVERCRPRRSLWT